MKRNSPNPLHLQPPQRTADEGLGDRLALLARASTPTPVRRRARWRAPFAGLAIVVATGGLAYGAQTAVQHITRPSPVVPGDQLSPRTSASPTTAGHSPSSFASTPATTHSPASLQHGRGKRMGTGHSPATTAPGHGGDNPGKHLAKGADQGNGQGNGQGRGNGKANGTSNGGAHGSTSGKGKKLGQTASGGKGHRQHQQQVPGSKGQRNGG